jgi:hypothetical protein
VFHEYIVSMLQSYVFLWHREPKQQLLMDRPFISEGNHQSDWWDICCSATTQVQFVQRRNQSSMFAAASAPLFSAVITSDILPFMFLQFSEEGEVI